MASALASLANATAVFTVVDAGGGTVTDPATGNVGPATDTLAVTMYLRQGSVTPADLQGVQVDAEVFEGYAINPQALDARIVTGTQGTLTFASDAASRCSVARVRHPYGTSGLLGSTLQSVLGDKIRIVRYLQV
jgi:hypothetical protein